MSFLHISFETVSCCLRSLVPLENHWFPFNNNPHLVPQIIAASQLVSSELLVSTSRNCRRQQKKNPPHVHKVQERMRGRSLAVTDSGSLSGAGIEEEKRRRRRRRGKVPRRALCTRDVKKMIFQKEHGGVSTSVFVMRRRCDRSASTRRSDGSDQERRCYYTRTRRL